MTAEAWAGLVATVGTAVVSIAVAIWLEFRGGSRNDRKEAEVVSSGAQLTRLQRIKQTGTLTCGVINHPPLAWSDYRDGEHVYGGYYVELAKEVGAQHGLSVNFQDFDWSDLRTALSSGSADLVLSVFETRDRLQFADFVAAFHKVGVSGVMCPNSTPLTDVSQLSDPSIRVGVVVGEVGWEYVTQELQLPRRQVIQVDSRTLRTAFSPLMSGDADIAIVDDLTCGQFVEAHPDFQHVFVNDSLYLCKNAIMVPKGEAEFARWVDSAFQAVRGSARLREIENQALAEAGGWIKRFR